MGKIKALPRIRAVVFDLDGTLVDSLADIAEAVNSTLAAHGRDIHPVEAYNAMVGRGLRQLLETASVRQPFAPSEVGTVFQELLEAYRAKPVVHTKAYDGVGTLLERLKGRIPLGVLSNKDNSMTRTIVTTLFPKVAFQTVFGSRPGKAHKPDPESLWEILSGWGVEPSCCAYLGDSDIDMETAQRGRVVACGAAWGFRGERELRQAGAAEVFPSPEAFGSWLEQRIEE